MAKKKPVAVVFVHGLAKKPPPEKLQEIWLWGLERANPKPQIFPEPNRPIKLITQGIPFIFNYYADVFYGKDYESEYGSYYESSRYENANEATLELANVLAVAGELEPPKPSTPREKRFLARLDAKLMAGAVKTAAEPAMEGAAPATAAGQLEIASWLPGPVKEAIIRKAAMEAYYYLFDKEYERADGARYKVRTELRQRLLDNLHAARLVADKTVIISHSMGTMVAYDVLRNVPDCPPVETLFTLGSPLGIQEVQDELVAEDAERVDFPAGKLARWINVFDPLDPVCGADPRFANDYASVDGKRVEDIEEGNWGSWRHTITHYFAGSKLRAKASEALGI